MNDSVLLGLGIFRRIWFTVAMFTPIFCQKIKQKYTMSSTIMKNIPLKLYFRCKLSQYQSSVASTGSYLCSIN